jgi:hypothetical protein
MTLPDTSTLIAVGSAVVAFVGGALMALRSVAPHTETKVDDKIVEYGDKALPLMVRVLEWLRSR